MARKNMNRPRRHHVVSRLHLANFTLTGQKDGRLWVFDQTQNRQWPSTPENSAHRRDFYRIHAGAAGDGLEVERGFGEFESDVAVVVREILATRTLPGPSRNYDLLMTFLALSVNRVPKVRDSISGFVDEVRQKEAFARRWLQESGGATAQGGTDELNQTWLVDNILQSVETLVPYLHARKWSLWVAENDTPDLICSDNPVAIIWTASNTGPWPPGFGQRNTQVSCPLSRHVLLVGSFEGQPDHAPLDALAVATANSCAGRNANQLYSSAEDFVWLMQDGRIGTKADLVQALSTARK